MNKNRTLITGAALVVVALVGLVWGQFNRTDPQVAELEQFRDEGLARMDQMTEEERRSQFREFRSRAESLSDDQRRQFFEGSREVFQQMMLQRMDRILSLSPEEQTKELDSIIDRMEERRQQRDSNSGGGRGWGGGNRGDMTPQQRDQRSKERLDRSTPELRAKIDRFRDMINDRRQERGMEPIEGGRGMFRGGRR